MESLSPPLETDASSPLIEALILASPEPVSSEKIASLIGLGSSEAVDRIVNHLNSEYEAQRRSFRIVARGGGWQFATLPEYGQWVRRLIFGSGKTRLSRAALETLSVIAYKQPITRAEIETIRGVDCSGVLSQLLHRRLIRITGKGKGPGRPLLYGTTTEFLKYFGINSLEDLPQPSELELEG